MQSNFCSPWEGEKERGYVFADMEQNTNLRQWDTVRVKLKIVFNTYVQMVLLIDGQNPCNVRVNISLLFRPFGIQHRTSGNASTFAR